jgi:hypothetical protein
VNSHWLSSDGTERRNFYNDFFIGEKASERQVKTMALIDRANINFLSFKA